MQSNKIQLSIISVLNSDLGLSVIIIKVTYKTYYVNSTADIFGDRIRLAIL